MVRGLDERTRWGETEVQQQLLTYIRSIAGVEVQPETSLTQQRVLDSMGFIELVAHTEASFGVRFEAEDLEHAFDSVQSIAALVRKKAGS